MKKIIYFISILITCASCGKSTEVKRLEAQNDSLKNVSIQTRTEFDELLSTLNVVEDGFNQIKDAENYLTIHSMANTDINKSVKEKLIEDMDFIQETLKSNKEKIDKLQKLYNSSANQSKELKKTIDRLTAQIESKTATIIALQEELGKKDQQIAQMSQSMKDLGDTLSQLKTESTAQKAEIAKQETELNTAYYVFGTKKELKDQNILSGGGLFSSTKVLQGDFNKGYFTKVNINELKEINLFTGAKPEVKTNMPKDSYTIEKDTQGNYVLYITNAQRFWSLSRYLVIVVD